MLKNKKLRVLVAIVVSFISVIVDIPVVREVLGVLVIAFIPGYMLYSILGIKGSLPVLVVISVGLSLAIVTAVTLLLNFVYPDPSPISFIPMMVTFYISLLVLYAVYFYKGKSICSP